MFFKQNKLIAMILLIIIVLFSFYSEYYAQKFRVENFDDVPSCNSGDVPTCSAVVLDHDPYEYTANAMNGEDYILKTQIVPPICPGYPSVINEQFQDESGVQNVYDEEIDGNQYGSTSNTTSIVNNSISNVQNSTSSSSSVVQNDQPSEQPSEQPSKQPLSSTNVPSNDSSSKAEIERLKAEISRLKQQSQNNSNKEDCPPCPPCDRCPEPIFTCEKTINYRSPNVGQYLPLPVLNDFSTFDNQS